MKKVLFGLGALAIALAVIPMFAAFEAHVINVTAKIENALEVTTEHLDFGTVFPQEHLEQQVRVALSQSFFDEDRVDDVEYFIRQKPKCGWTTDEGKVLLGLPTATGHVKPDGNGGYTVDCGPTPTPTPAVSPANWGALPLLCPYISKDGEKADQDPIGGIDGVTPSFHKPWTVSTTSVTWLDTMGRLAKSIGDVADTWIIDLAVPCFGGHCAQDWADFVHKHNQTADPNQYTQPIENEHKIFGCDLWIEVNGVSECDPGEHIVVSDTTNTVQGDGNAVPVPTPYHSAWTASVPGATWIWSESPVDPGPDQTETFIKQFSVTGAIVGTPQLMIATDNTYSVVVNGSAICSSSDADNFHLGTQDVCNVTNLVSGINTIEITVKNIGAGNQSTNPAGLLYKLTYETTCQTP